MGRRNIIKYTKKLSFILLCAMFFIVNFNYVNAEDIV